MNMVKNEITSSVSAAGHTVIPDGTVITELTGGAVNIFPIIACIKYTAIEPPINWNRI